MEYNVLWIDDLCNESTGRDFIGFAEQEDINITAFESHEEGIAHLLENRENYQAVILDAAVKEKKDDTKLGLAGLRASRDRLIQINQETYLPWFIFTGQGRYQKSDDFRDSYGDFYIKGDDNEKLLTDIKNKIENSPDLKIKRKYTEPFECFGDNYLDRKYERSLINIIRVLDDDSFKDAEKMLFNPCRILLEAVFKEITSIDEKILPYAISNFENQRPGLVNCSKYLSGIQVRIKDQTYAGPKFLKDHISQQIQTIIRLCHPASHDIQEHYTRYTLKSVLWAIFDVLIWLKNFADDHRSL